MSAEPRDEDLASWVSDARGRTLEMYADLEDEQLAVPYLSIVNPPLWEMGHVAWFQEHWVLRRTLGQRSHFDQSDAWWDSAKVAHRARWDLPLPSRKEILTYLEGVRDRVLEGMSKHGIDDALRYFVLLSVFHEDMHGEAFAYTRQTLGWPAPRFAADAGTDPSDPLPGDVEVPGGTARIGAERSQTGFVFDNEKWAHDVELGPYRIARAPVTQDAFAAFVEERGYHRRELWTDEGWAWRASVAAEHPVYWRRRGTGWERRVFDRWLAISEQPHQPMIHVNAHEAEAFCRWARRRLPTEPEWEHAAGGAAATAVQRVGNVWEWTSTTFHPYPGFERDPYAEYSEPWFGDHRVLRGGCFATRARLLRPTWRNFYTPERRDVWAGFRTCALD